MMGTIDQFKKIHPPQLVSWNSSLEMSFLWPVSWKQALCKGFQIFLLQHVATCSFANGIHWGQKSLFHLIAYSPSFREVRPGTSGRNWCRDHGKVLAHSLWLAQVAFLCYPGPPSQEWHHLQWDSHSHINDQSRKCLTAFSIDQSSGGIFSNEVPLAQMNLNICQVENEPAHNHTYWGQSWKNRIAKRLTG